MMWLVGSRAEGRDECAEDIRGTPRVEAVRDSAEEVPDAQQLCMVPPRLGQPSPEQLDNGYGDGHQPLGEP